MRKFLSVLLLLTLPFLTRAAHLVGGHLSYVCNGSNNYEITLRVYRDCGGGGAAFDAVAEIAIYDAANNLIQSLSVNKGPTVSVPANTGNPCLSVPPGLCTEYAEYVTSVTLPPLAGGYTLVHQRCCRNGSISNIPTPGSWGNTYTVNIPSMDTLCNSSPTFTSEPPITICVNDPLNLTIPAADPDGDSLYFEFCEILHGGGQSGGGCNAVIPSPPCPPPFTMIPFNAPFTTLEPLPGSPPITLDPASGQLIGTPDLLGQYVVGICVTEFRDGAPLTTVRLDYQFNVANCISNLSADMVTPTEDPTILCDGLTVQFQNQSASFNSLHWDFGVPGTGTDTSNLTNPVFTYPDTGTYSVTLIVNPGWPCSDTVVETFTLIPLATGNIQWDGVACFEVQGIEWTATGTFPPGTTYQWTFGPDANVPIWNGFTPPPVSWTTAGWQTATFTATYPPGCTFETEDSVEISSLALSVDAGPDQTILEGEFATLLGSGGVEYYWWSSYPAKYSDRFTSSPAVWPETDTTVFYVLVTDALGCQGIDSCRVYVVRPEVANEVQNLITPNGDGINDALDLTNLLGPEPASVYIYNRWGGEVWSDVDYDNNWRGTSNGGDDLPDGTYYILVRRESGIVYSGAVTIWRSDS